MKFFRQLSTLLIVVLFIFNAQCQFETYEIVEFSHKKPSKIMNKDFDGDGDLDILMGYWGDDKIVFYENLGNGTFSDEVSITSSTTNYGSIYDFEIVDMDLDGDYDIIFPSKDLGFIKWLENEGQFPFQTDHLVTNQVTWCYNIVTADFDFDGDIDVASTSTYDDKFAWYENIGSGVFGPQQVISSLTTNPGDIRSADMDNDGDQDIVLITNDGDDILLYANNGSGQFGAPVTILHQVSSFHELELIDLDADNFLDVIYLDRGTGFPNYMSGGVSLCKNLGGNNFQTSQNLMGQSYLAECFVMVDLDNDLDLDILMAVNGIDSNLDVDSVVCYVNNGNSIFSLSSTNEWYGNGQGAPASISSGDYNNDGFSDYAVCSSGNNINRAATYINNGSLSFNFGEDLFTEVYLPNDVFSLDVTEDGLPDYIVGSLSGKLSYYPNLGNGQFGNQVLVGYTGDDQLKSLVCEDFDMDGDIDMVSLTHTGILYFHENNGGGSYLSKVQIVQTSAMNKATMRTTDINGDGISDIIIGFYTLNKIISLLGNGDGTFEQEVVISNSINGISQMSLGDLDNDGDSDLAIASFTTNRIYSFENDGTGIFNNLTLIDYLSNPKTVSIVDIDDDGLNDIITASENQSKIIWFKNLGNWDFQNEQLISNQFAKPSRIICADLDSDGDKDVLAISYIGSFSDKLCWFENLSNANFSLPKNIADSLQYPMEISASDIDIDGDIDVLFSLDLMHSIGFSKNMFNSERQIKGRLYIDLNQNLEYDSLDIGFPQAGIYSSPSNQTTYVYNDGRYFINFVDTASFLITPGSILNWGILTDSSSYTINANALFTNADSLDFGFYPTNPLDSILVDITGSFPRCNDTINYWINYSNVGSTIVSGIISLELNDSLTYIQSSLPLDSVVGNIYYWSYDSLLYFSHDMLNIHVSVPDFNSMGDTLTSFVNIYTLDGLNQVVSGFSDSLSQIVVCAYDPNDKKVEPKGIDSPGYISPNTERLEYLVRFQNTGSDTAQTVVIKDQLNQYLNWESLQVIASSHSCLHQINSNGQVSFVFGNIMLPDSNVNNLGSQGFVKFSVELLPNLPLGTQIHNTAKIYFDLNPAVTTNSAVNTIYNCSSIVAPFSNLHVCEGEILHAQANLSGTNLNWNIIGVATGIGNSIDWYADTSGNFNIEIFVSNSICQTDGIFPITIYPEIPISFIDTLNVCPGDSIFVFGQFQSESGTYYNQLNSANGCDSLIAIQLDVFPEIVTTIIDTMVVCFGDSIEIFGNYSLQAGLYTQTLQGEHGCDSLIGIQLQVIPYNAVTIIDTTVTCFGDSVVVFGNYETLSGLYLDTLQNIASCDSLIGIQLVVLSEPIVNILDTIIYCDGDSVLVFGNYVSQPGIYSETFTGEYGCDSLIGYLVNVNLNYGNSYDSISICQGDSTLVFGVFQKDPGDYTFQTTGVNGCDSIAFINLEVYDTPIVQFIEIEQDTLCISDQPVVLNTGIPLGGIYSGTGVINDYFEPSIASVGLHVLYYSISDTVGCSSIDSIQMYVDGCLGELEVNQDYITIHPNPVTDNLIIEFKSQNGSYSLKILNNLGQIVYEMNTIYTEQFVVDLSKFSVGMYTIHLIDNSENKINRIEKILKIE